MKNQLSNLILAVKFLIPWPIFVFLLCTCISSSYPAAHKYICSSLPGISCRAAAADAPAGRGCHLPRHSTHWGTAPGSKDTDEEKLCSIQSRKLTTGRASGQLGMSLSKKFGALNLHTNPLNLCTKHTATKITAHWNSASVDNTKRNAMEGSIY